MDDENTHCHDSDYQYGHPPDPKFIDHSDPDSSWNNDQDSWFLLEISPGYPHVLQETWGCPIEANPHEAMAEEQPLASQPTESQVVKAKELARLQPELQSVQYTLADECNHFSHVSQPYELEVQEAQLSLAPKQKQFPSTTQSEEELQAVNGPSCSPTQAHQDELAASTDIPKLQEYCFHSSVDCVQECLDTPVLDGIPQRLALLRPKPKPWLSAEGSPTMAKCP